MTTFVFANNVQTTLSAPANSSATILTLASSANLPTLSAGQVLPLTLNDAATKLVYEIVYVTAISGTSLTVTRAQEGTGAQNWSVGDYAFCDQTAGSTAAKNGDPAVPFNTSTASPGDNTNLSASTAFVTAAVASKAPLASPTFTGTPAGPTAATGTDTTQLATTAFVLSQMNAQSWSNVTGSRTAGSNYTNSTGIPITVCVSATVSGVSSTAALTMTVVVNSVTIITQVTYVGTGPEGATVSFIVPNGQTYSVSLSAGSGTPAVTVWAELR